MRSAQTFQLGCLPRKPSSLLSALCSLSLPPPPADPTPLRLRASLPPHFRRRFCPTSLRCTRNASSPLALAVWPGSRGKLGIWWWNVGNGNRGGGGEMRPGASGGHHLRDPRAGAAGRGVPLPLRPRVQAVAPPPGRPRLPPPAPARGGRPILLLPRVPHPAQEAPHRLVEEDHQTHQPLQEPRAGLRPGAGIRARARHRFLTSFVRGGAGLLDDAKPLAERGGLVLLRLFPRGAAGRKSLSLCVCSLLTGKLDALPCFDGGSVRGYAVLPSPSTNHGGTPQLPADGYSNLCKVLLVRVHPGSNQLNIHSFSTAAAAAFQNWDTTPVNGFSGDAGSFSGPYGSSVATICCDTARWFFQKDGPTGPTMFTVDVSIDTGRVCTNMIILDGPVDLSIHARFLLLYGRFLYQKNNRLVIWTFSDIQEDEMLLAAVWVGEKSGTALGICCSTVAVHTFLISSPSQQPR